MKPRYLLDTNICIYIRKQQPAQVLSRFQQLQGCELAMSVITYGELMLGAEKSQDSATAKQKLRTLRSRIPVLDINEDVGRHYGEIRGHLEKQDNMIGNNDLWIAAHAKALGLTVVTNNGKEFNRVPGLSLENWV